MKARITRIERSIVAVFLAGGLLLTLGGAGIGRAQQRQGRAPRVIELQEILIEGRIQKPNAFYILNRSNLGYEVLDLRTSFVRDVVRSVQSDPF